jgi:hypothetical protein
MPACEGLSGTSRSTHLLFSKARARQIKITDASEQNGSLEMVKAKDNRDNHHRF